jgi:Cytochrome c
MNRSLMTASILATLILLALVASAFAGGWATITLDQWPAQISVNEPVLIGFTVRQHGNDATRLAGLSPTITLRNATTGESFTVEAKDEGAVGHYAASVTFPAAGAYAWSIQAFGMDQPMPELMVSQAVAKLAVQPKFSLIPAVSAGLLGVAILCMVLGLVLRKRARWAAALVLAGVLAAGVGIASAASQPRSGAASADKPAAGGNQAQGNGALGQEVNGQPLTQAEYGKELFIAKGCVTCHVNPHIEPAFKAFQVNIGKDLTNYAASPEFLRLWLKDPRSIKPETKMPTLELSQAEIEALIAFLSPPAKTE